jgi:regulator of PEP synthase PpsR (kinase-PPPase family)
MKLPSEIQQLRGRLYGLTIAAKRLEEIRTERIKHMSNDRRFGKNYATLANCEYEIRMAEALMHQENIPFLDATTKSVEELATTILHAAKLQRRIY